MEQTAQSANSTMAGTATRWMQLTENVLSVLMNIEKNQSPVSNQHQKRSPAQTADYIE